VRMGRKILAGLLVVAVLGVPAVVGGAPGPAVACPVQGGVLRFGLYRDPTGLDPHLNFGATSSSLQGNVYDTLVEYDARGNLGPGSRNRGRSPSPRSTSSSCAGM